MSQITPEEFKTIRESLNLSTRDVADMFDIRGERTVRAWEAGRAPIPAEIAGKLRRIDEAVGKRANYLTDCARRSKEATFYRCETVEECDIFWPAMEQDAEFVFPKIYNACIARARQSLIGLGVDVVITSPPDDDA